MEVFPNVFLGNRYDAANASLLKKLRVGSVLNVTDDLKNHFDNKPTAEQKVYRKHADDDECSTDSTAVADIFLPDDSVEGLGLGMASRMSDTPVDLIFDQEDNDVVMDTSSAITSFAQDTKDDAVSFEVSQEPSISDRKIIKAKRKKDKKPAEPSPSTSVYDIKIVEFEKVIQYKRISIPDSMEQDLKQHFADGVEFIHQAIQPDTTGRQFNVLVHCREARSRSVSLCIAYAMNKLGWSLADAFNNIQTKTHNHTRINDGFKRQLMEYELELLVQRRTGEPLDLATLENTHDFFPRRKRNRDYQESELEYDSDDYDEEDEYCEMQPKKKRARKNKNNAPASEIANSFPTVDSAGRKQLTLFSMFKKKILQQVTATAPATTDSTSVPATTEESTALAEIKQLPEDGTREQALLNHVEDQVNKLDALIKAKQAQKKVQAVVSAVPAPVVQAKKEKKVPAAPVKKLADVTNTKKQSSISSFFKKV
jgi:protein-tyrosine phosphatase